MSVPGCRVFWTATVMAMRAVTSVGEHVDYFRGALANKTLFMLFFASFTGTAACAAILSFMMSWWLAFYIMGGWLVFQVAPIVLAFKTGRQDNFIRQYDERRLTRTCHDEVALTYEHVLAVWSQEGEPR